jgi:hypothetical protein
MTIVQLLIVGGIGGMIYKLDEIEANQRAQMARQEMTDRRLDRLEARTYRGAETP